MSNATVQLPNPTTPMAYFSPEEAFQITVALYVLVGSLSALSWDIFINLHTDLKILRTKGVSLSIVVYFISRFSSQAFLLGDTITQTYPIGNCENYSRVHLLYPIAIPSTCLLFFIRIRAMYTGNNWAVGFFFLMWLAVLGGSITTTLGLSAVNIGSTNYCILTHLDHYVVATAIITAVHDTLIFCAMSWRLMQNSLVEPNMKNGVGIALFGRHLPAFSRSLLQDGQAYYLTTIVLGIITSFLFFIPSLPVVYRSIIGVPNVVLINNMACHVYRKTRLGVYRESVPTTASFVIPSFVLFNRTRSAQSEKSEGEDPSSALRTGGKESPSNDPR